MTGFKPTLKVLFIALSVAIILLAGACSAGTVYTPSGLPSRIAFSSDRDQTVHIYTVNPDGTDNRSTSNAPEILDGLPTWSPTGKEIAFTSNQSQDYEIWIMNEDGSNRLKLTDMTGWDGLPRWSPDGSKIVFVGERGDAAGHKSFEIFIMDSDGNNVKNLTCIEHLDTHSHEGHSHRVAWDSCPTFSPDGKKLLFASNRDGDNSRPLLYIMNTDGSDQKKFGGPAEIDGTEPDWSPVTNQIVFCRGSAAKGESWVMDGGSPLPLITARKITDNPDNNRSPVWSPDGKQIAFISDKYGNDDVFIMNADGSNVRRVTYEKSNERHPSWR